MKITYASINEKGKRPYQEDSVGIQCWQRDYLFLVADGLGGHGCGDVASGEIVKYAVEIYEEGKSPEAYFQRLFTEGNEKLRRMQDERRMSNGMKTTLSVLVVQAEEIYGAYMGDSRIYILREGKIIYRSLDHSVPQMLVAAGEITEKQIRNHPDRSRLLRVLGDRERDAKPQKIGPFRLEEGMAALVCTDGFWENILDNEMERTWKKSSAPEEWLQRMKKIVERRAFLKNQDNYSAVVFFSDRGV